MEKPPGRPRLDNFAHSPFVAKDFEPAIYANLTRRSQCVSGDVKNSPSVAKIRRRAKGGRLTSRADVWLR